VTSPDPLYRVKRARVTKLKEKALLGNLSSHDAENVLCLVLIQMIVRLNSLLDESNAQTNANLDAEKKTPD
jgi:hypothetical protein